MREKREEGGYLSDRRIMGNGKPGKTMVSGHVEDHSEIKKKKITPNRAALT